MKTTSEETIERRTTKLPSRVPNLDNTDGSEVLKADAMVPDTTATPKLRHDGVMQAAAHLGAKIRALLPYGSQSNMLASELITRLTMKSGRPDILAEARLALDLALQEKRKSLGIGVRPVRTDADAEGGARGQVRTDAAADISEKYGPPGTWWQKGYKP
jgi:hypothetical protein